MIRALDIRRPSQSRKATELLGTKAEKVVSELFLLELSSAFSRRNDLISEVAKQAGASPAATVMACVIYIMSKYDLKLIETPNDRVFTPMGRVSAAVGAGIGHSSEYKLRSLDLLHLAHLLVIKESGYPVEGIVTSDEEFRRVGNLLKKKGVRPILPQ